MWSFFFAVECRKGKKQLEQIGFHVFIKQEKAYKIFVGPLGSKTEAVQIQKRLKEEDIASFITKID